MTGNVYFVRCRKFVKIGFAKDVIARIAGLQTGCPYELELIAVLPGEESLERIFHRVLQDKRSRGEWFHLDENLSLRIRLMMNRLRNGTITEVSSEADVLRLLDTKLHRHRRYGRLKRQDRAELFARRAEKCDPA